MNVSGVPMRLEKVDLNLFIVFESLYKERSVTKVAILLNLTQPAVSNSLARLRQTFDDPLFTRTPGGMAPTPVADNVISDVRKALQLLGRSVETNARFNPSSSEKTFHLAMNDLAEYLLLDSLQPSVQEEAPSAVINAYYVNRETATGSLKSGTIDLLIDSPEVNAKELYHKPLVQLPYVIAMSKSHPLAKKKLTLERYLSSKHIHVSSRKAGRGQVDVALHAEGCNRKVAMRVKHYLIAAKITASTELLWTVPEVLAKQLPLVTKNIPFEVTPLKWSLYWHKQANEDPANLWMREKILSLMAE